MKLGIMQPYFFPYIGYWQLINAVDVYIIYDDVNFIKGGWINRNRILVSGKPTYFNVQMNGASPNKKINEIEVSRDATFKRKLLNSLTMSYSKAPYFKEVFLLLREIIMHDEKNLAMYLENIIRKISEYLEIDTKIIMSSTIEKNNALKGKDKVIHICKLFDAKEYVNAIGGQDLYDYKTFKENGLKLNFLKTNGIVYKQFNQEFIPNLSIIDVLMFNTKEEVKSMLQNYELINEFTRVLKR